jgi:hypothetical protein
MHTWKPAEDRLLGTASDRNIAKRIGVTALSVFNRRKRLGVPAFAKNVTLAVSDSHSARAKASTEAGVHSAREKNNRSRCPSRSMGS